MPPILSMAPIMGVTNCVYRRTYARFFRGYDYAVAPFIVSRDNSRKIKHATLRDILPERNTPGFTLVPQILSKTGADFVVLAAAMAELGYDTVNWNMGCPLLKVRRKGRGSGLLSQPDFVRSFLDTVMPQLKIKLSLKVRLGGETPDDLPKLLPFLNDYPLFEIIIHPRTGKQMYEGVADQDAFARCLPLSRHQIVYNGDIDSVGTFEKLQKRFPAINRWMIGRGGVTDPFLPEKILTGLRSPESEQRAVFVTFHDALLADYQQELSGPAHILARMKEAWFYWAKGFAGGEDFFRTVTRAKTVERYQAAAENFFKQTKLLEK